MLFQFIKSMHINSLESIRYSTQVRTSELSICQLFLANLFQFPTQEEEDIDMDTVHDSQAFIYHHLNMLERPSTPGE